jgi:hypothetical protein
MRSLVALVAILAVQSGAAFAQGTAPVEQPTGEMLPQASEPSGDQIAANTIGEEAVICRDRQRTGTRFASRVCRTQVQGDEEQERARELLRLMLEHSGHNNSE